AAEQFYHDILGFDFIARFGRVMTFLAAGGYHHHLACRVGAGPTESGAVGLNWFEILLADRPALEAVLNRLRAADIDVTEDAEGYFLRDFSNTGIRLNAVL
ncbi:MAG: VOC family protein, partial [Calditrichaeota bacterium]|nr:VOC family protein [Calditrichota bacterium]